MFFVRRQAFNDATGPDGPSAVLTALSNELIVANVHFPNDVKVFARLGVALRAMYHLSEANIQMRGRTWGLQDLRMWHVLVEAEFVDEFHNLLRELPGRDNAHVTGEAIIEFDTLVFSV